jgi:DUF218 domain
MSEIIINPLPRITPITKLIYVVSSGAYFSRGQFFPGKYGIVNDQGIYCDGQNRCQKAFELYDHGSGPIKVITSGGHLPIINCDTDSLDSMPTYSKIYKDYLISLGVLEKDIMETSDCHETLGEIFTALKIAETEGSEQISLVISSLQEERIKLMLELLYNYDDVIRYNDQKKLLSYLLVNNFLYKYPDKVKTVNYFTSLKTYRYVTIKLIICNVNTKTTNTSINKKIALERKAISDLLSGRYYLS